MIRRLSLVGLGLLGGSVAKAARAQGLADEIVAVGRDRARLEPALREGMVDRVSTSLEDGVAGADFCLLATPVATLTALLPA
ncbi:MAG: NAD(P)-binding domain-containing protein, partial [Candidatus Rokuibacteriota bacterium]